LIPVLLLLLLFILILIIALSFKIFAILWSDWLSLRIFWNNLDMLCKQLSSCNWRRIILKLLRTWRFHIHLWVWIIIIVPCLFISLICSRIFKNICVCILLSTKIVAMLKLCLRQFHRRQMIFFILRIVGDDRLELLNELLVIAVKYGRSKSSGILF